ncbi:MAG: MlaE family lipid ABC transporter permease subunit [Planctomycetaceae bacterium]|nr:MlaE family lipid ABC transporter permease subunit [Planctomycetaceae bacterium]
MSPESSAVLAVQPVGVESQQEPSGRTRIRLSGSLGMAQLGAAWERLEALSARAVGSVVIDLSQLERLDGAGAALLVELRSELRRRGLAADFVGAGDAVAHNLGLYAQQPALRRCKAAPCRQGLFEQVGHFALGQLRQVTDVLGRLGELWRESVHVVRRPRELPFGDLPKLVERTGPDAVAIVALIAGLVGMILAFQSALQLRNFGAEIYVANLVGLSIVRELGPLMAAILLAGRSGAAIAAEIGTMRVSEEIDALRALGLSPYSYLVLPRILALVLCLPPLALVADAAGILGGMFVAAGLLDIAPIAYWNQTVSAIGTSDLLTGLVKSAFFGLIVGLVACDRGLSTQGGAEGVGRSTTSAVVTTILLLVVADALFAWGFSMLGW